MTIELKNNGKVVVVFDEFTKAQQVPLFCSVCNFAMKTIDDSISFREKGCCSKCDIYWSFKVGVDLSNPSLYPSKLFLEEWKEYIKDREINSRPILIFK